MRLQWPRAAATASKRLAFNRAMLADWMTQLPDPVATFSLAEAALLRAPALVATLSPRPERLEGLLLGDVAVASADAADALVDTMLTYGVSYELGVASERQPQPWHEEEGCEVDAGAC
jgi:hypothetical protein